MHNKSIAVLILAAGCSNRMGKPKQLLPIGDKTLLGVVVKNALESSVDKVYCVLGANEVKVKLSLEKYDVETINNSNYKSGLSTSIVEGIGKIKGRGHDAILIMLGDQPLVDSNYLNELINAYNENPDKIIASRYPNGIGVPTVIPVIYFSYLLDLEGDKGAKEFLTSQQENSILVEGCQFMDIDTEYDYQELLKRLEL